MFCTPLQCDVRHKFFTISVGPEKESKFDDYLGQQHVLVKEILETSQEMREICYSPHVLVTNEIKL